MKTVIFKIYRGSNDTQYWEEFELELTFGMNVISALMQIQKNPVNRHGEKVEPVAWEQGCLEEVCGSCSMLINGKPRQACTALIEPYIQENGATITLAPEEQAVITALEKLNVISLNNVVKYMEQTYGISAAAPVASGAASAAGASVVSATGASTAASSATGSSAASAFC